MTVVSAILLTHCRPPQPNTPNYKPRYTVLVENVARAETHRMQAEKREQEKTQQEIETKKKEEKEGNDMSFILSRSPKTKRGPWSSRMPEPANKKQRI